MEKLVRFLKVATDDIPADLGLSTKPLEGGAGSPAATVASKVAVRVREECAGVSGRLWTCC